MSLKPATYETPRPKIGQLVKVTSLAIAGSVAVALAHRLAAETGIRGLSLVCLIGVVALAFANGANDLPKSIATLVGSGTTSYRRALWMGVGAMAIGGGLAMLWSSALLRLFSAGGITSVNSHIYPMFPMTVVCAAACWVVLATRFGLPVSTTHALIGGSVGGALAAQGVGGVHWGTLVLAVVVPLVAGPLIALPVGFAIRRAVSRRQAEGVEQNQHRLHLLSAASSSAARVLNDAPKIAGIGMLVLAFGKAVPPSNHIASVIGVTVAAMAAGGLWASRRVNQTLAFRLTALDARSGLAANASNTVLVGAGSFLGLPLSTTHVSGAALIGASLGDRGGRIQWNVLHDIVTAWVVTVPASALLATILWWLLRSMSPWA